MLLQWRDLRKNGVLISLSQVVMMGFRGTLKPGLIKCIKTSHDYNLGFSVEEIEGHYLAGGNIEEVIENARLLQEEKITFRKPMIMALDLMKGNLGEIVRTYLLAKERYQNLTIDEFFLRLIEGEDVINQVKNQTFTIT